MEMENIIGSQFHTWAALVIIFNKLNISYTKLYLIIKLIKLYANALKYTPSYEWSISLLY